MSQRFVCHFSCGAASAVATKLTLAQFPRDRVVIFNAFVKEEDADNRRFLNDCEGWDLIRWRGAVASAIRGKRGQAFLRELVAALDSLPDKRLIDKELVKDGEYCALGAIGKARGLQMENVDPDDRQGIAEFFGIPDALAAEIMYVNDDWLWWKEATPEKRFETVRNWAEKHLKPVVGSEGGEKG